VTDQPSDAGTAAAPLETPSAPPRRRRLRTVVALLGYAAIIGLAAFAVDREDVFAALSRLTLAHVSFVLALVAVHLGTRAIRYHWLAVRAGARNYRLLDGARIFLLGLGAASVTPGRAGDVVKAELLHEHGVRRATGLGLIFIERMLDLIVVSGTIVVTGFLLAHQEQRQGLVIAALALLVALIVAVAAVTINSLRRVAIASFATALGTVLRRVSRARIIDITSRLFDVWDEVFASPRGLTRYLVITVVAWLADFVKLWGLLRACGADVDLVTILFVYPTSLLAGLLSLLPFSEGVVGVAAVALLGRLAGVDLPTATAAVAVDRAIATLSPLAIYGILATFRPSHRQPARS